MTSNPLPIPGWYTDPSGTGHRYWDGQTWTDRYAPPEQTVIEGPNHVLHGLLTLFTWPLCGGWAWVWLFVALNNGKRVRVVR